MPADVVNQVIAKLLPWFLLAGLASLLATAFKLIILPKLKGRLGEASINFWARCSLDHNVYHLIPDVMLPTPDGTTQIDHVIVSRYGIFVVETKTYKGWIYGDKNKAKWTQVIYRHKEHFQNPLHQNYKHTKTLAELTGIPESYFKSMVVFIGKSTFKTEMPANVIKVQDFVRYIKTFQDPIIRDEQVLEVAGAIREWADTVPDKQRAGHVANLRESKRPDSANASAPACPKCGAAMALRTNRKNGSLFWGCPNYPACRGTRTAS
jgi:restriction system protein